MSNNLFIFIISFFLTFLDVKGFTTSLTHRDASLDRYERVRNSIKRSMSNVNRFGGFSSGDARSRVKSAHGEYIMELSYGTPPVSQVGIIDTGSNLIWTQCKPCSNCFNQTLPVFNPSKSSTYKAQSCDSKACKSFYKRQIRCSRNNTCGYTYAYSDGSQTTGDLAYETVTFNSKENVSFHGVTFGCGHDNEGNVANSGAGLVGLGGGPLSLVSQLGSSIHGKFSYCLVPPSMEGNHTSTIRFGTEAKVSGPKVITTPIEKGTFVTYYYLTLNGLSVEKTKIPFNTKSFVNDSPSNKGNIIIDSGTSLTFLPDEMFGNLSSALDGVIKGKKVDDPTGLMDLCYRTRDGGPGLNVTNVTAHFDGGDLVLNPHNTFIHVSNNVSCLAMVPLRGLRSAILGNIAQRNILIGYDTVNGKLSFKPADCIKEQGTIGI